MSTTTDSTTITEPTTPGAAGRRGAPTSLSTDGAGVDEPAGSELDEARVEAFADSLLARFNGAFVTFMIDLGHRTGLWEALAAGPGTSDDLAGRVGLQERYVREWLGGIVTAGIAYYDAATATYDLPAEHAACLAGDTELNMAPASQIATHLARYVGPVATAFREGGGVPYEQYRPEFTEVMDGLSRPTFDGLLVDGIVPLAEGLGERLSEGARVADIGCGTGHSTVVLADAYPASTFCGYDLAADAIERGRREAAARGLANVTFDVIDVAALPTEPGFDVVFAFDAIHDQAAPHVVLDRVFEALTPGGTFAMLDIRASSHVERNVDNPLAPMLYGISLLHCMTVSLAAGGSGLGAVWGEELALEMLRAAGFVDLEVHEVPGDPFDSLYVARRPA